MCVKEFRYLLLSHGIVEQLSTMPAAMDDLKVAIQLHFLVGGMELVGLVDGDLGILVAVQHEQGRVGFVDVENGAGEPGKFRGILRAFPKEKLQCGHANA
jgi:hypothetical protein